MEKEEERNIRRGSTESREKNGDKEKNNKQKRKIYWIDEDAEKVGRRMKTRKRKKK